MQVKAGRAVYPVAGTLLFLFHVMQTPNALATVKAIRFGRLVDGTGRDLTNAVVVVENDRIRSVEVGDLAVPENAEVIDLARYTGIPGLIDVHTHITYYWDQRPGTRPWSQLETRSPDETMSLAEENARKTLETGVTTVRNLHASHYTDVRMRDRIHRGAMAGPRMFVSGHGLVLSPYPAGPGSVTRSRRLKDRIQQIEAAVRQQIEAGADWVKIFGSTGSADDVSGDQTFTFEEMKAAVDTAHKMGRRVAVHSYGPDGARAAVQAGTDSIEHATDMDDDTIVEMARRRIFYVPTIDHNRYYAEYRGQFGYDQDAAEQLNGYIRRNVKTARRALQAGVRFAMGSDAVFTMFGQNTRELTWFVRIGMTPAQALATATTNAAALLGQEKNLGAVMPGYYADIVAVEGNPLDDINVLLDKVRWVMKGGVIVVDKTKQ